ncbi:HpcH/HpaI aldolase/citrate lyase family protein [Micromonospora sp. NPDC051141]|uniref:HpcH/HpaI aldolase/citrate lyase family protein n=1 Tax=Micromonospora sp. NPDC051141 TaxID=3364284 RepID=UPI0037992A65
MTLVEGVPRSRSRGICRCLLVTPATRMERFLGSAAGPADIHLLDLEDSVPAEAKHGARQAVGLLDPAEVPDGYSLRVNPVRSPEGVRDLHMVLDARTAPDMIVLPKVESPHDVELVDEVLAGAGIDTVLWAILETAAGLENAMAVARSRPRLVALTFGAADFCADTGTAMEWEPLLMARSRVALAARSAGIEAVDGPTFDLDDAAALESDARRAAGLGYTGKVAVHPGQVDAINEVFTPSAADVHRADRIVGEFRRTGASIITMDGRMLGPPFLRQAESTLARAGRSR